MTPPAYPVLTPTWKLTLLFDGDCPLCLREVAWLRRRDRLGRLVFEDIAAPDFEPARYDRTREQLMAAMHGLRPDGTLLVGADVFREAYGAVGLGWLVAPSRLPLLRPLVDAGYRLFARHRIRIGRLFGRSCDEGTCSLPKDGGLRRTA
jgi:predicted DCC family thiol-disulfide oxidoreductase YuxK